MSRLAPLAAAALALASQPTLAAEARLVASFDDPAGDATGPGTYLPPADPTFADGDFDLRRFAVYDEGDTVRLEVTLGAPIHREPAGAEKDARRPASGLAFRNVDVYVDSDPGPGSGFSASLPGRRIAFTDGKTWETAVVLTPWPDATRAAVAKALPRAAGHVLFPDSVEVRERTLVVRVPTAALGGTPSKAWGWSVQLSGARREAPGEDPDALTMPVLPARGAWSFGGAPAGEAHPRVVDVLLPPGADQKLVLGGFDAATGAFARVPFVYGDGASAPEARTSAGPSLRPSLSPRLGPFAPSGPPREAATAEGTGPAGGSGPVLTVAEITEDRVRLAGPNIGLAQNQLGRVLGRDGATVGHVVIEQVLENGVQARVVSGRDNVRWGARVRFDAKTITR